MRLIDIHAHFRNCNVVHAYTKEGGKHVVYRCESNQRLATLPKEDEILDDLVMFACIYFKIDNPPELDHLSHLRGIVGSALD